MSLVTRFKTPVATTATTVRRGGTNTPASGCFQNAVFTSARIPFASKVRRGQSGKCNVIEETNKSSTSVSECRRNHAAKSNKMSARQLHSESSSCPTPPLLMLEGDSFEISNEGVSRTLYKLQKHLTDEITVKEGGGGGFVVEEQYSIDNALKKFILHASPTVEKHAISGNKKISSNTIELGQSLFSFDLKEIQGGVVGSAGTGSMTWESSIAMALFFSENPDLLRGHVIELGSGVGLGGILTQVACQFAAKKNATSSHNGKRSPLSSITLTDYNPDVLEQCIKNIQRAKLEKNSENDVYTNISSLNWYDFFPKDLHPHKKCTNSKPTHNYDTVIASDCAYLREHIKPLAETISQLLGCAKENQLHLFGPYNRAVLHELITELRRERGMLVTVQEIKLERYRLKSGSHEVDLRESREIFTKQADSLFEENACEYASFNTAHFLHIAATRRRKDQEDREREIAAKSAMSAID